MESDRTVDESALEAGVDDSIRLTDFFFFFFLLACLVQFVSVSDVTRLSKVLCGRPSLQVDFTIGSRSTHPVKIS